MQKTVQEYYGDIGSRLGYLLILKGSQHFGYYPEGKATITEDQAQIEHHNLIAKALKLEKSDVVLDAGCGQGFVACDLAKRFGCTITGIDITPYIVKRAQARAKRLNLQEQVSFKHMDYTNLDFPDNSFDKVYTVETLCHAPDLEQALRNFYRVLKPGGKVVFMEYHKKPTSEFSTEQKKMYELIIKGTHSASLDLLEEGNFIKLLHKTGFINTQDVDITKNFEPSVKRLYKLAKYPYKVIKALNLQERFVNTTIGVEFYKMWIAGLLGYSMYTGEKSD